MDGATGCPWKSPRFPDALPIPTPGSSLTPLAGAQQKGALHRLRRLRGVELPVALFDAASPLVAGNGGTDMIRASSLACSGNFLLRLAICQSKHLIAKGGWGALAASWFFGLGARAPWSRCSSCLLAVVGVLAEAIFLAGVPLL